MDSLFSQKLSSTGFSHGAASLQNNSGVKPMICFRNQHHFAFFFKTQEIIFIFNNISPNAKKRGDQKQYFWEKLMFLRKKLIWDTHWHVRWMESQSVISLQFLAHKINQSIIQSICNKIIKLLRKKISSFFLRKVKVLRK